MEPVLSLRTILLKQGENFTLSIPSLDLLPGRIYALTGPNGAGKSTLLKVMALLAAPKSGTICFAGSAPEDLMQQRQKVTLVEQSPYLLAWNVSDNLAFGLKVRGIRGKEQKRRIKSALQMVGLDGFESRSADQLSGGEVQRVALARALVLQPQILLLDEPTSNIDTKSLRDFEELLRKLPEYGVTVVVATHDLLLAERLNGETLMIENGRLLNKNHQSINLDDAKEKRAWPKPLNVRGL